jgi:hypothetical protein
MAREKAPTQAPSTKAPKEPGRIKQMYDVFNMTRRYDSTAIWWMIGGFVLPIIAGVLLAIFLSSDAIIGFILYIVAGVLGGFLLFLIILGRRAERAAYSQITGQSGAVGAVLKGSLRRGWQASEMPVNVSPRTHDAVYRAIGRAGVVLIGEGPKSRTQRMLEEERRTISRILPNVPVNFLYVGPDSDSVPLHKLAGSMRKFKPVLRKTEVMAVGNRLSSLAKAPMGIPKGIDPYKARAPRPR